MHTPLRHSPGCHLVQQHPLWPPTVGFLTPELIQEEGGIAVHISHRFVACNCLKPQPQGPCVFDVKKVAWHCQPWLVGTVHLYSLDHSHFLSCPSILRSCIIFWYQTETHICRCTSNPLICRSEVKLNTVFHYSLITGVSRGRSECQMRCHDDFLCKSIIS